MPRSAFASCSESAGTTSGSKAVIAGMKKAIPTPSATCATTSCQKAAAPVSRRTATAACAAKRMRSAPTRIVRRGNRSPIVPAASMTRPKAIAWQPSARPAWPSVPPIDNTAKGRAARTAKLPTAEASSAPSNRRSWHPRRAATFALIRHLSRPSQKDPSTQDF